MMKHLIFAACLLGTFCAEAQVPSYTTRAQEYIFKYKDLAMAEQMRSGVPAAITLGQGILETEAGKSELATLANNHFGIKCKKEWTGETFAHDDDAPQECFRKYPTAIQSYKDHSDYLRTSKRYISCFEQSPTNYQAWAKELRKCGYATNPRYAQILIKIIEDFNLQNYTYVALGNKPPVMIASAASPIAAVMMAEKATPGEAAPEHDNPAARQAEEPVYGKAVHKDGVRGFYAHKGDVLLEYAIQYKVRYAKLLEINALPDAPLASDMFVYLEKGSRIQTILTRDNSATRVSENVVASATPVIEQERISAPPVIQEQKADVSQQNTTPIEPAVAQKEEATPASDVPAAQPIVEQAAPAPVVSTTAEPVVTKEPTAKPFNIADEVAIEEKKNEPAAPQDEFSRLKARMDKVVNAPAQVKPAAQPVSARPTPVVVVKAPAVTEKTAAPLAAAAPGAKAYHTVKAGETAFGISRQYNITMKELMALNNFNFEAIKVGQKLRVK